MHIGGGGRVNWCHSLLRLFLILTGKRSIDCSEHFEFQFSKISKLADDSILVHAQGKKQSGVAKLMAWAWKQQAQGGTWPQRGESTHETFRQGAGAVQQARLQRRCAGRGLLSTHRVVNESSACTSWGPTDAGVRAAST